MKLWASQTISLVGSQVTFLALPIVAAISLHASALEMGILTAAGSLPALIFGLFAGAAIDRRRRRPVMIAADLCRAALLSAVPLCWYLGVLSVPLLLLVAFLVGSCGLLFDIAYQAFLPLLVERSQLLEANSKSELSRTSAEIAGPGLGGLLVQLLSAPVALIADAISYLGSGLLISLIRKEEAKPTHAESAIGHRAEILEGVRIVARTRLLRISAITVCLLGLFNAAIEAVFVLFVLNDLEISAALLGSIFAVGSAGFVVGSLLPQRTAQRLGFGKATALGLAVVAVSDFFVPLADINRTVAIPMLMAAQFAFGLGITVFRVNLASLRQALVPAELRGRVASVHFLVAGGAALVGALAGGLLAEIIGLRATLGVGAAGELLAALGMLVSPLRTLRQLPTSDESEDLANAPGQA